MPLTIQAAGAGCHTARDGWEVLECFTYEFATLARRYADGLGYRAVELSREELLAGLGR
jgi:hypothetical protein